MVEGPVPPPPENQAKQVSWARKMLFVSTDLIFPGFHKATTDEIDPRQYITLRVRSSLNLQSVLYGDALFFVLWVISYLSTFTVSVSVLKELHGNLALVMSLLFIIVNVLRILSGLRGNRRDNLELLALFWMSTLVVQIPLLGFALFTDIFTPVRLPFTMAMDAVMMGILLVELVIGTYHMKGLVRDELRAIQVAKLTRSYLPRYRGPAAAAAAAAAGGAGAFQFPIRHVGGGDALMPPTPPGPGENGEYSSSDEEDEDGRDWSSEDDDDESVAKVNKEVRKINIGYQMNIRRLVPAPEEEESDVGTGNSSSAGDSDDSNKVTSTSDVLRHRSVPRSLAELSVD